MRPLRSRFFLFVVSLVFCLESELELRAQPKANFELRFDLFELPGVEKTKGINHIVQDTFGFLWFGGEGLYRWDGHHVKTFLHDANDTTSLSSNIISTLHLDQDGQLWVGTSNAGLNLYHEHSETFTRYSPDPEDSHSLCHPKVNCIAEDPEGNLWIGTYGGLSFLKKGSDVFKNYLPDFNDSINLHLQSISDLLVDRNGKIWISTWNATLSCLDPQTDTFVPYYGHNTTEGFVQPQSGLLGLWEFQDGNIWIGGINGEVYTFEPDREWFEQFPSDPDKAMSLSFGKELSKEVFVHSMLEDHNGHIWIGGLRGGIKHYDPSSGQVSHFTANRGDKEPGPTSNYIWNLFQAKDRTIWLAGGTEGPVNKLILPERPHDLARDDFFFQAFKKTPIYFELSDPEANEKWFGTLDMAYDDRENAIWSKFVYEIQKNGETDTYPVLASFHKDSGKIQFYQLHDLELESSDQGLYIGNLSSRWNALGMAVADDGKIWGTYTSKEVGVFSFDPQTGNVQNYRHIPGNDNSLLSNEVINMLLDSQGDVWAGYNGAGMSRFDPKTEKWTHFLNNAKSSNQAGSFSALILHEDLEGKILAGGINLHENRSAIYEIDPLTDKVKNFPLPINLLENVRALVKKDGIIYFGVDHRGLGVIEPNGSVNFLTREEHNFPIETIASMGFDNQGHLWVQSRETPDFLCMDLKKEHWWSIANKSGLGGIGRSSMTKSPDGHLFFSTSPGGWAEIAPEALKNTFKQSNPTGLRLTGLYIQGELQTPGKSKFLPQPVWLLDRLDLSYNAKSFALSFSNFQFDPPETRYHYRLFPLEKEWKLIKGNPKVEYDRLPAGNYQFQVKAYGENGLFGEQHQILNLVIHPPWWKSWWAYGLYVIVTFLLLTGIYFYLRRRWHLQTRLQVETERAERLKELDTFKSRFYTNITHEFRTPLTVIKGMVDQIREPEKIKPILQRNTERLLTMVNQLLELSKLETNSLSINWVQADIIPYLQYLTESCHSLAERQKLNLAFFSQEDRLVMDFDENKIQQILINLLSNAIKFTPDYGSVKVTVDKTIRQDQFVLELRVQDTGKGIPQDKLPFIFDRFYQADDSTTRPGEGTGIGLALVKELVHLLDGEIEVISEVGKGSSFTVYLPIHQDAVNREVLTPAISSVTQVPAKTPEYEIGDIPSSNGVDQPQVLVIEDNADVRDYIFSCLQQDYVLDAAPNGKVGLEKALERIPDVVLCDIMMPEMDGFEVCRRLKTDRRTSHIPIILLTAKATQEDKVTGLSKGADAYLTKPFDKEELLIRLHNLAAQSQRLRERLSGPDAEQDQPTELELMERAFLEDVHQIIEDHLDNEDFDTSYLCREIGMSRAQLYRKLKALTGDPTASYIRSFKLKKAKALLERTKLPIGEVASQVGYKDFSHFSRSFIKEFGIKPSEVKE